MFKEYREHVKTEARNRKADNDLQVHIIDESEYPTMITKINMPFMYARRVIVNTYYPKLGQGSIETVSSSINNE